MVTCSERRWKGDRLHSSIRKRSLPKKYYHPVVRVAVIYQGMLYLVNRGKKSFVSPDTIDYPFYSYVLFRHSIESTVRETMGGLGEKEDVMPRFLIRYTFENEKVKHLVNLYVMCVRSEKVMESDQTTERKALDFQTD